MKGPATLFEEATSFAALLAAARRAVRGKKHRPAVRELIFDLEPRLIRLSEALRAGSWMPGPYRTFTVYEPKQRLIAAAPLDDRIVHHGVCGAVDELSALNLQLKTAATTIAPVSEGIPFLGMRVFRGTMRLQHAGRSRFFRNRRLRQEALATGVISGTRYVNSEMSVFSHLAHADTFGLRSHALSGGLRA